MGMTPNHLPIVLARKPLSEKTVAANVLKWGTGALNIDATRVKYSASNPPIPQLAQGKTNIKSTKTMFDGPSLQKSETKAVIGGSLEGRWPANVCHDGSDEVVSMFPETGKAAPTTGITFSTSWKNSGKSGINHIGHGDSGSAARFFYNTNYEEETLQEFYNGKIELHHGDSTKVLKEFPDNHFHSIVCDPPYHLTSIVKRFGKEGSAPAQFGKDGAYARASRGFMQKSWDGGDIAFRPEFWYEVGRVLKPGGHLVAFAASRNYHRMACAIEDAGFEIRDQIMWLYGCYSEDTECLTKAGWKLYNDLSLEDEILQWDSVQDRLTWAKPKKLFVYDAPDEMVNIANRHTDQLVTKNHRCYTKIRRHNRDPKPFEYEVELAGNLKKHWHKDFPLASTLNEGRYVDYPYLIGWWLTDAWRHRDGKACMFSQSKPATLNKLSSALKAADCNVSEYERNRGNPNHSNEHTFYVTGPLADYLIEHFPNRELTWEVMGWDYESRCRLIRGLLDGDGSQKEPNERGPNYSGAFWSQNRERLDIFSALCVSVNKRNHIDYNKGVVYINHVKNSTQLQSRHTCATVPYSGDKVWCLETDTGAFVVRRNGRAFISGNSGFPKSHDVSKGIDKAANARREVVGPGQWAGRGAISANGSNDGWKRPSHDDHIERMETAPATEEAKKWQGYGTALKPAVEPIVLARKPLSEKTVAANVLTHGTGALNIDATRVPLSPETDASQLRTINRNVREDTNGQTWGMSKQVADKPQVVRPEGRWPANVCHDSSDEVVSMFPSVQKGRGTYTRQSRAEGEWLHSKEAGSTQLGYNDEEGSAARFYYSAKANKEDRAGSSHPTVKPVKLMEWLVKMVTPKGGTLLDPFAGSGTTGQAALNCGMKAVLIEREDEYVEDIKRRFSKINLDQFT